MAKSQTNQPNGQVTSNGDHSNTKEEEVRQDLVSFWIIRSRTFLENF